MIDLSYRQVGALFAPALIGAFLILYATAAYGVGVSADSVAYLDAARNFADRGAFVTDMLPGPSQPLTHWPILYPAALSVAYRLSDDALTGARWLNVFFFALYVIGIEALVLIQTRKSVASALAAGLFASLTYDSLHIFARAWSETLFLPLFVWGMFFLGVYLMRGHTQPLLLASSLFALAWIARYAGVTMLIAGTLAILLLSNRSYRLRLRDTLLFGVIMVVPIGLLLVRNYALTDNLANRSLGIQLMDSRWWLGAYETIAAWLIPASAPLPFRWLSIAAATCLWAVGAVICFIRAAENRALNAETGRRWTIPATQLLFSITYVAFTIMATLVADSAIPADLRILSPLLSSLIVVTTYALFEVLTQAEADRRMWLSASVLAFVGLAIIFQMARSTRWALAAHDTGLHYNTKAFRDSSVTAEIRSVPEDTTFYSNRPQIVYFLNGRKSYGMGEIICSDSCDSIVQALNQVHESNAENVTLVWSSEYDRGQCGPCLDELASTVGLELTTNDGAFALYQSSSQK